LVRITPAKQYRLQLHVTTNAKTHWRRANGAQYENRARTRRPVQ
jgi:hypothetical protein